MEDARTWIEETGLCLFLPRKQFSSSVAPSFIEAIAGRREAAPDSRQIAAAEQMLVRLENDGIAVRLNLQGQPGEQPDYVVAAWVLPYVYALRGDRDWRRVPQLTGSRAVSQLAVQAYKLLESGGDATVAQLKHALGREVTEGAVLRAITELWQQLRIIPVIAAPGQPARWQLLRHRFQKAIAEGASTSQVTAISVLASIFLQAVIAATMEDVELFLAPLTARSKVREVLRGLVATRQVHSIAQGPAPHFYVAGTLPEFAPPASIYGTGTFSTSSYLGRFDRSEESAARSAFPPPARTAPAPRPQPQPAAQAPAARPAEAHPHRKPQKPAGSGKSAASRTHFGRPGARTHDRKHPASRPGQSANGSRTVRNGSDARSASRPSGSRPANGRSTSSRSSSSRSASSRSASPRSAGTARPASSSRWSKPAPKSTNGSRNGTRSAASNGHRANGLALRPSNGKTGNGKAGNGKPSRTWSGPAASRNGHSNGDSNRHSNGHANGHTNGHANNQSNGHKSASKSATNGHKPAHARTDARSKSRTANKGRKPAYAAGAGAAGSKRYGFTARPKQALPKRGGRPKTGAKKRG
ncbi:MAG TPA: hypothetical protein VND90_04425 [Terracidiphilus sp.]|nr:hypothetical protein [Terracidiphilus sp.]